MENQCVVVGVDAVGTDGRTPMGGRSVVVDAWGTPVCDPLPGAPGPDDGPAPTRIEIVDVDLDALREARRSLPVLDDRRLHVDARL